MSLYRKIVKGTLRERLDFLANQTPDERRDLREEVDLSRGLLLNSLAILDEITEGELKAQISVETKIAATHAVTNALEQTAKLVEKLAKIESLNLDKFPAACVPFFLADISRALHAQFGEDPRILVAMDEIQRMPVRTNDGPLPALPEVIIGVD